MYCCRVSRLAEAFALPPAVNCFDAKSIDAWRLDTSPVTKSHVFGTKPGFTEWQQSHAWEVEEKASTPSQA